MDEFGFAKGLPKKEENGSVESFQTLVRADVELLSLFQSGLKAELRES